jgi:DNA-binding CsgD family transcriptional regulator
MLAVQKKSRSSKTQRHNAESKGSSRPSQQKVSAKTPSLQIKPPAPRDVLTARERAVLTQIARGASSREIGELLGVSARTIEFHRANIRRKLGVKNVVDLLLLALRNGGKS